MEKILEFSKDRYSNGSKYYRFQCECLSPKDAMDLEVEGCGTDGNGKWVAITMHYYSKGIWQRVKDAFACLRGDWGWREFIVRDDDHKYISDIFNPDKQYSELP